MAENVKKGGRHQVEDAVRAVVQPVSPVSPVQSGQSVSPVSPTERTPEKMSERMPEKTTEATAGRMPERHPLEPFVPEGAKILILGSFPPKRERWSMEFYYPNRINDMWRIMGLVFFGDKEALMRAGGRDFDEGRIRSFCTEKGIALSDTALEVIRLADNASDKFLEIVTPADIGALLDRMPQCRAVVTTGQKASETFASEMGATVPPVGDAVDFSYNGRSMKFYRMPSASRAYPLAIDKKAAFYGKMFREVLGESAVFCDS